jgi:hypothetical protein
VTVTDPSPFGPPPKVPKFTGPKPDIPHFDYPFRFGRGGSAVTVEQDSAEEITNAALAVLKTERGFRQELPDFGIDSPMFREGGVSEQGIKHALDVWEPRANYTLDASDIRDLAQTVNVTVEPN